MSIAAQTVNLKPSCSVFCLFHEGWGNNDVVNVIKGLVYALKYEHKDVYSEPTNIITSQILAVPKDFYILHYNGSINFKVVSWGLYTNFKLLPICQGKILTLASLEH